MVCELVSGTRFLILVSCIQPGQLSVATFRLHDRILLSESIPQILEISWHSYLYLPFASSFIAQQVEDFYTELLNTHSDLLYSERSINRKGSGNHMNTE